MQVVQDVLEKGAVCPSLDPSSKMAVGDLATFETHSPIKWHSLPHTPHWSCGPGTCCASPERASRPERTVASHGLCHGSGLNRTSPPCADGTIVIHNVELYSRCVVVYG